MAVTSPICECEEKEYKVNSMVTNWWIHDDMARAQGCELATYNTAAELSLINQALAAAMLPDITNGNNVLGAAFIGLSRPNAGNAANDAGWMWVDGCTAYSTATTFWNTKEPTNTLSPFGVLFYSSAGGKTVGAAGTAIAIVSYPAVYECCAAESLSSSSKMSTKKSRGGGMKKSSSRRLELHH